MKSGIFALSALALVCAMATLPAKADSVLYDNTGPTSYGYNGNAGIPINSGWAATDSFTLASNSTLSGVNFVVWVFPGDKLASVNWLITNSAFGGAMEGSGTATVAGTYLGKDPQGYNDDLYQESFTLPGLSLTAGTYYLQLQYAATLDGYPAFWDASNGPSDAVINQYGSIFDANGFGGFAGTNSETFQIFGNTPEPSSFLLLGSGLASLAGLLRRRLMA